MLILRAMHDHASHGRTMRDAVAHADLDLARQQAKALEETRIDDSAEPVWHDKLEAMHAAAARVAQAADLREASLGAAALARTCGDCHAVFAGVRTILVAEAPPGGLDAVPRMERHQWAVARLWNGLVIPSPKVWAAGARALADAPLDPERATPNGSLDAIDQLASSVRHLGLKAQDAEGDDERTAIYGELLMTCSGCHQRLLPASGEVKP